MWNESAIFNWKWREINDSDKHFITSFRIFCNISFNEDWVVYVNTVYLYNSFHTLGYE